MEGEILIVERDPDVGQTVKIMVEATGRRAVNVSTVAAALAELSKKKVDLVMTNRAFMSCDQRISLPWLAKQMQPEVSVVLTSANEPINLDAVDALDGYLRKPFTIADIQSVIGRSGGSAAYCRPER